MSYLSENTLEKKKQDTWGWGAPAEDPVVTDTWGWREPAEDPAIPSNHLVLTTTAVTAHTPRNTRHTYMCIKQMNNFLQMNMRQLKSRDAHTDSSVS